MASFQAKIGWERPRKTEIKKIVPVSSYPTRNRKFLKNRKQIQKLKNIIWLLSSQDRLGKAEKEKKKNHSDGFPPNP